MGYSPWGLRELDTTERLTLVWLIALSIRSSVFIRKRCMDKSMLCLSIRLNGHLGCCPMDTWLVMENNTSVNMTVQVSL